VAGFILLLIYREYFAPPTAGGFQYAAPFLFYIILGIPFILTISFLTGAFILFKDVFLESKPLDETLLISVFIFLWLSIISISYYSQFLRF